MVNYKQDLPPKGGYAPANVARGLQLKGPSSAAILIGGTAFMAWGWYKLHMSNKRNRYYEWRKVEARIGIVPMLQAEEDRRYLQWVRDCRAEEAEIMKDVPGWEVGQSVYHTDKWHRPPVYHNLDKLWNTGIID